MIYKMLLATVLCVLISAIAAEITVTYENYSLFKLIPNNDKQVNILKDLYNSGKDYDFWIPPIRVDQFVSIVSPPELRSELEELLKEHEISGGVVLENLQEAFDQQKISRQKRTANRRLYWTNYQLLEDINAWFYDLQREHPNIVTVIVSGQSHEGRNITGIRISRRSGRRAFFLEAGMQGADWLTPVTLTYIADQLIRAPDSVSMQMSNDFDWYIFPVTNPDGYEFSQDSVRMWVRNRRPTTGSNIGVDLARNWNAHWGVFGASWNPSHNHFIGPGPFSEPESRAMSRYVDSIGSQLFGYLSFRSFGQRILLPFAHSTDHVGNYEEVVTIMRRAMGSLAVRYGTLYRVGTSAEVHDGVTGSAADWVKNRHNVPMVATYLLRDEGTHGFALPVAQVLPNCIEVYDSLQAIFREARFINFI